ncbi:hypothetical protein HRbin36_00420 [bacterium HR36]|nr:hypothetical protein HRbin36_00420 [bacterium HR36]
MAGVDAFAGRIGCDQDSHLGVVPERLLRLAPPFPANVAVHVHHRLRTAQQGGDAFRRVVQGVPVFGEDDELLVGGGHASGRCFCIGARDSSPCAIRLIRSAWRCFCIGVRRLCDPALNGRGHEEL